MKHFSHALYYQRNNEASQAYKNLQDCDKLLDSSFVTLVYIVWSDSYFVITLVNNIKTSMRSCITKNVI